MTRLSPFMAVVHLQPTGRIDDVTAPHLHDWSSLNVGVASEIGGRDQQWWKVESTAIVPLSCSSHIATAEKLSATLNITALNVPANEHITQSYWTCEIQSTAVMNPPLGTIGQGRQNRKWVHVML